MKIYNATDDLILDIAVDDTSYRYRVIMGDHNLTLRYSLPEHVEIPVGAYCDFEGTRYTLMRPEDFKKVNSRNYDYTVVFQSNEYLARIWKFRNPVDGRLKFPLTAKPKEHLQMFVDNMNRRDSGWSIGDCIDGAEVLINYDHDYCKDALAKMASELKTEYHFNGKCVSLGKLEVNKTTPLSLSYGRGNGFKTGIGRTNAGDNPPTEVLFVQGGTENIDRSKYPPKEESRVRASSGGCLLLPRNATLQFDGDFFEGQDGFNADIAKTYISDDLGLSIRRVGAEGSFLAEDSLDCSSIYPKRVGVVSDVQRISREGGDLYDIIDDSIPDTLNYEDYIIRDETMTIRFQSGMLAGKEFDVKYKHNERRFEIVPQEIDGIMMPGDCFIPETGNEYAIFHCYLPDAYINAYTGEHPVKEGAEWDMFREAVKHLYDAEQQHFTFSGTLDGLWAKKDWANIGGRIVLGGFVLFSDKDFAPDGVRVRITGIKDYINNPHSPEIELSNSTIGASVGTTLKTLTAQEVNVETKHEEAIQFTRRRWRDAQETMSMLESALLNNFTESVNPVAVRTMQMLVGDEALQFEFVDSIPADGDTRHPAVVNHVVTWKGTTRQLDIPGGIIKHLTIGIPKDLTASHSPQAYHYWQLDKRTTGELTDGAQKYYLYAKVPQEGGKGEFRLEEEAKSFNSDGSYWLLVGVLNSEYGGERSFVPLYGFTEILPGRVTTERVVSSNGNSFFDMQAEAMKLGNRLDFNTNGDGQLILRGTLVQSESGQTEYIGCFRGGWSSTSTYFQGDEVTFLDAATNTTSTYRYYNATPATGILPTNSAYWQVIAKGSQGIPGVTGEDGDYTEIRYAANNNAAIPPAFDATNLDTALWLTSLSAVQTSGQYVWQTSARMTAKGTRKTTWATPIRLTGLQGANGEQGKSPAMVFRGNYDKNAEYVGNEYRVDVVRALVDGTTQYFIASIDAGIFKGIAPPNANKWHNFGATFESVATSLLLAENANIANLIFRNQRLESVAQTNGVPNFFIDGLKNIASFAAGKAVFDGAGARIGWIFVDGKDLVGVDNSGIERLRITPNSLPAVNLTAKISDPVVKTWGGNATYIGQTDTEVAFEYSANYDAGQDPYDEGDNTLFGFVEFDIPENNTRLDFGLLESAYSNLKDINGNTIPTSSITERLYANVYKKEGASWTQTGYVALSEGQREIAVPAGRIRVAIYLSVYVSGYSSWSGTISISAQALPTKTAQEEVFIGKDGIMAVYNSNYMRFHSGEGFKVGIGNIGLQVTSSGIQKTSDGGHKWENL